MLALVLPHRFSLGPHGCSAPRATIPYTGPRFTEEDKPMRRMTIIAAGFAAFTMLVLAGPALAGFGALAHDDDSGKYGLSSNEESQAKADDVAMKECGGDKCKIVFRTVARQCGAIAVAETGGSSAWGGAKAPQRAAAELEAITSCQKHTKGHCKIRSAECNR